MNSCELLHTPELRIKLKKQLLYERKQVISPLPVPTYQLGKLAGTRASLVRLGGRFLFSPATGTTFLCARRPLRPLKSSSQQCHQKFAGDVASGKFNKCIMPGCV